GVPRPDLPDLDRRRLRGPRVRRRQRGDLRPAGPLLADRPHPDADVRDEQVPPGPPDGRVPDDRRVPAPVPRPGHEDPANGAPNPAYDDVESNGTPDGRVAQREAFI